MSDLRLGFTGDVMLGRLVDERQRGGRPVTAVWGDLLDRLRGLDGLFVNLECCLSNRGSPWTRTNRPFHFRASPDWAVPALREAGVDWACLANNHVLDYGEEALFDTLDHLDEAGIAHAGAGRNEREAWEPTTVSVDGFDVGFVAFTDNTPEYAADGDSPGTARVPIDPDDEGVLKTVADAVARARADDPDLLVASLHWGPNMVEEPPEEFRRFADWLLGEGIDLLHGHSAHVFQGIEIDDGRSIIYDAGDFVDDYRVDPDLRNDRSFLFEVGVDGGEPTELRLVPVEIENYAVREASPHVAEWSRSRMRDLSEPFGTTFERDGEHLVASLR